MSEQQQHQLALEVCLIEQFGERHIIRPIEAGRLVGFGDQSGCKLPFPGKFPIPTVLVGIRKMVRVADLSGYITGLSATAPTEPAAPARRPGCSPRSFSWLAREVQHVLACHRRRAMGCKKSG